MKSFPIYFIIIVFTIIYSLFSVHCFGQFGRDAYELDGLNKRIIPSLQMSTDIKSGLISYSYIFPLTNITKSLYLNINLGGKAGIWINKKVTSDVQSIGFILFPVGTGLTFREFNPVNISLQGGVAGGIEGENIFTNSAAGIEGPSAVFTGGFYGSGSIFIPLKNKLGIDVGFNKIFILHINNLSYISIGVAFGKYE